MAMACNIMQMTIVEWNTKLNHHRTSALLGRSRSPIMHCIASSIIIYIYVTVRRRANRIIELSYVVSSELYRRRAKRRPPLSRLHP